MAAQLGAQKIQLETQAQAQLLQLEYQLKMQLEDLKGKYGITEQQIQSGVKQEMEDEKENRKDERVKKQAVEQSKLISQRKGERSELTEELDPIQAILNK